jgi:hypothetical protein
MMGRASCRCALHGAKEGLDSKPWSLKTTPRGQTRPRNFDKDNNAHGVANAETSRERML